MMRVRIADGSLKGIAGIAEHDGFVLMTIGRGRVRTAQGTLKTFFDTLAAVAAPAAVAGYGYDSTRVYTNASTVTVTGGAAPFTYLWTNIGGDALDITTPAAATTTFSSNTVTTGSPESGSFKCTVTDADGTVVDSNTVTADVSVFYGGYL